MMVEPSGANDEEASKLTVNGAVPEVVLALRTTAYWLPLGHCAAKRRTAIESKPNEMMPLIFMCSF
jgi:hypothetical protein